ncbi:hypothetical protein AVO45_01675 [Ruegeria marisrubri]|uniref:Short-chain dehydrogenase n=1 Tax=Ruegeria marisrubri TaxID=1685379 RepID=A0A117KH42_9RHOB|nr:NnrS family protein [Ruegeria marisrubri]KUJ85723.1 hypothetical protein AVO45_01675 [Ruegeria marisrubri]
MVRGASQRLSRQMGAVGQFWDAPFRPLFLAAALCAIATVAQWPLGLPPEVLSPGLWHAHEMLFGFGGAAVGGYMLTALPSWTGKQPVSGRPLVFLTLLWLLARIAAFNAGQLAPPVLALAGASYFLCLAALLTRQIVASRSWPKLGFVLAIIVLAGTDAALLRALALGELAVGREFVHAAVFVFALLMSLVGGKLVPAFTESWLAQSGHVGARPVPRLPVAAAIALVAAMGLQATGLDLPTGGLPVITAALLLWHMRGWRSSTILSEPLLVALHLGYLWLPLGLGLAGIARLAPLPISDTDALHMLTVGAMGGLVFAIAGRAAARRVAGGLRAGPGFASGFALIWLATCVRAALPENLTLSGALWCLGWLVFTLRLLPALFGPVDRPVLSGRRSQTPLKAPES